ncbi:MAG: glycosyltransferase family 9 protein [Bacteroidales bacterium]|nr:glycosyltransferase family 9 protein [Bacteroidales bacterium]
MVKRFLIIQPAFIGDAILTSALLEELYTTCPEAEIDLLLRKGNESLYDKHPFINRLYVWDKSNNKITHLLQIISEVRKTKYDRIINLHRFASSGLITMLARSKVKAGFDKNPFSISFNIVKKHIIGDGRHETDRNAEMIEDISKKRIRKPELYPSAQNFRSVEKYKQNKYICIAPTSVWKTKALPEDKWVELIKQIKDTYRIFLMGAPADYQSCERILSLSGGENVQNLAGKLNLLESAALLKDAKMNYVNDSAPLHLSSAVNAPVTAVFCSTVPDFGFGPLSDNRYVVEVNHKLSCRPCGLHGFVKCPEGHFKCGKNITIDQLIMPLK